MWIAAYGSSCRLSNMIFLPSQGIAGSIPTILGFNIGSKNWKRCWETIWKAFLTLLVFSWVLCLIILSFARPIASLFATTTEMEDILTYMARITTIPLFFCCIVMTMFSIYQSERSGKFQLYIACVGWVGMILCVYAIPAAFDDVKGFKYVMFGFHFVMLISTFVLLPCKIAHYISKSKEEVIECEDSEEMGSGRAEERANDAEIIANN
eukprot:gnl/Carplike_NY0171/11419_a16296_125.p1 GENE.gnl/Carplike_NY0171/11419_a16296_125~~gnl/Carplike_NY0171/11419_a16296_125.p1  ORF type:complete len:218 (-),score=49.17 gnl/Carplike_NY0171/11419_a16296_125:409-1035(-)